MCRGRDGERPRASLRKDEHSELETQMHRDRQEARRKMELEWGDEMIRDKHELRLSPPNSWYSQVSMSADASFPVAPKWIRMNFP